MNTPLFRGPRLATKLFVLMSLALVVIPWFSYLYLKEMESFLVDGQANAQLLTAEGISTLLNGRTDLFYELPLSPDGYEQLYAYPLTTPIRIDGKSSDWEDVL
ncbi:MAG: two-component system sensor histidine kinase ChvG, partial [Crocinitomicaceae bacterium]